MRLRWPAPEYCPYRLNGEIDKGGHPYFRNDRGTPKPDLLVHVRGTGDNHVFTISRNAYSLGPEYAARSNPALGLQ
jgi:hypothetical protein